MEDSQAAASLLRKCTRHVLVHPGIKASISLIMERFAWNGLQKGLREWTRCFIPCQTIQAHRHNNAPIGTFDAPDARFHNVHIDPVGPLSPLQQHRFLLTCVDHFTLFCEAITLVGSHTETAILAFLQSWIARFGAPKSGTTDRVPKFESTLFAKMCKFLGYERIDCISPSRQRNGRAFTPPY